MRRLMIENNTDYRTEDLRAFFKAGLLAMGASLAKKIVVDYAGKRKSCWATYPAYGGEGFRIRMVLDRDDPFSTGRSRDMASTFHHEVMHTLGLRHADMDKETLWSKKPQPWADGLVIRRKAEKPKAVKAPLVERRAAKAQRALLKWQRVEARAKAAVKRWAAKVRYYARRKVEAETATDQVAAVASSKTEQ